MTMHGKRIFAAAMTVASVMFLFGCTAADDYMEERRAVREEKAEKAKAERAEKAEKAKADAEEAARQKAIKERDDRRAAQAREDTVKDDLDISTSNPSAWFHETDETMKEIRKRLVAAISKMDQLVAKYEGKAEDAAGKAGGYPKLLEELEAAKAAGKWPVAVGKFFIDSEEKCDAKIEEVRAASGKTVVTAAKDQALLNGVRENAKAARKRLKAFDEDYAEFNRRWDMFRAGSLNGVPKQLNAQVKDAVAVTKRFMDEWEAVE